MPRKEGAQAVLHELLRALARHHPAGVRLRARGQRPGHADDSLEKPDGPFLRGRLSKSAKDPLEDERVRARAYGKASIVVGDAESASCFHEL